MRCNFIPALPICHARLRARKPENRPYPTTLQTWGNHIRRRRLDLGLLQREAAARIGCATASVTSWERNRAQPKVSELPGIIHFLGYAPLEPCEPWFARLARSRQAMGLSRKRLGAAVGVDESTVKRWEDGKGRPLAHVRERLRAILGFAPP